MGSLYKSMCHLRAYMLYKRLYITLGFFNIVRVYNMYNCKKDIVYITKKMFISRSDDQQHKD